MLRKGVLLVVLLTLCACGAPEFDPPPPPAPPSLFGESVATEATWYGPLFHGHMTSSGEMFDMEKLTASHPTLPFGTKVEVTSPQSRKAVRVVINDRHNLKEGQDLCLSRKAAIAIGVYPRLEFPVQYMVME